VSVSLNVAIPGSVDVAIVGAGIGGLICGVELARQGLSVCVFDKGLVAGGYAQSFRRRGYHFDLSLHHVGGFDPGCFMHGVLESLGILEKLTLHRPETLFRAEFPGFGITLPNHREGIIEALCAQFPGERAGILALFDFLPRLKMDVISPLLDASFNTPLHDRPSSEYLERSYQQLLSEHISDRSLLAVLGQMWMYLGLPPSQSSANYSACVNATAFVEGEWSIVGGGAAFVRGIIERLRELGGECFTGKEVVEVSMGDGAVRQVVLADGRTVACRMVVIATSPVHAFDALIPPGEVSEIYRYRLRQMTPSLSMYSMYLGLNCPASDVGLSDGHFFYNHDTDPDGAFERVLRHDIDRTDYAVSCSTDLRTVVTPERCSILTFSEPTPASDWLHLPPDEYRNRKQQVQKILLTKYERRFPGLSRCIDVMEFITPRSFHRFTNNTDGAVFGFAQGLEQSNTRRLRNRTPVAGLYLTGAWTSPGGGYEGAVAGGIETAKTLLGDYRFELPAPPVRLLPDVSRASSPSPEEGSDLQQPLIQFDTRVSLDSHYRFSFPVLVYGDELNSRGNTDASSYLKYMDRARMEAIEEICRTQGKKPWMSEYQIKVYRIEARCATVTRLADPLEVRTGIRRISHHRVSFDQRILNRRNNRIVADAAIEVLFLNNQDQLVPCPEGLLNTDDAVPDFKKDRTEPLPFREDEHFPFRSRFRVYFEDTDMQAIMFHVSYVKYCERAMFDLIRSIWPDVSTNVWMSRTNATIARIDIRYLKAALLGERLEVRTTLVDMDARRLCFGQRIINQQTGEVVSDAVTDVEFRDNRGNAFPVPKEIADVAKAHLIETKRG